MLLDAGNPIDLDTVSPLPPIGHSGKIIRIGLNHADHSAENGFKQPHASERLDYKGKIVAVISGARRDI